MRVLHVLSEYYPLIKTGGLADVGAALPQALRRRRVDARVVLPGYPQVIDELRSPQPLWSDANLFGGGGARILKGTFGTDPAPAYVLDQPGHFAREGNPYLDANGEDYEDNDRRFAALCWAGAMLCNGADPQFAPQIAHGHDWQAGLLPAYLTLHFDRAIPSVQTIHNVHYAGAFDMSSAGHLSLPAEALQMEGVEFYGRISFLKAGLHYASHITTVSPTYAQELTSPEYGAGFDGLLRSRRDALTGILNGVDYEHWSPARDPALVCSYDARRFSGKARCRAALCERLGVDGDPAVPVVGVVSRLIWQKGIDVLLDAAAPLLREGAMRLVMLGDGDAALAASAARLAEELPTRMAFVRGYDESLAHQIQAGCDGLAVPSRFEPCGLTQLYALRYGTVPFVRRTGGLADSVTDLSEAGEGEKEATGFTFEELEPSTLRATFERGIALFSDRKAWRRLQRAGMRSDFGWGRSAREYAALYRTLAPSRRSRPARPNLGAASRRSG